MIRFSISEKKKILLYVSYEKNVDYLVQKLRLKFPTSESSSFPTTSLIYMYTSLININYLMIIICFLFTYIILKCLIPRLPGCYCQESALFQNSDINPCSYIPWGRTIYDSVFERKTRKGNTCCIENKIHDSKYTHSYIYLHLQINKYLDD